MSWLVLVLAAILGVLWIVALATGGVAAWFLWITFAVAVLLIAISLYEVVQLPRTRRPV
jgi:hypothetical protein